VSASHFAYQEYYSKQHRNEQYTPLLLKKKKGKENQNKRMNLLTKLEKKLPESFP
jgi:hypothetical protein